MMELDDTSGNIWGLTTLHDDGHLIVGDEMCIQMAIAEISVQLEAFCLVHICIRLIAWWAFRITSITPKTELDVSTQKKETFTLLINLKVYARNRNDHNLETLCLGTRLQFVNGDRPCDVVLVVKVKRKSGHILHKILIFEISPTAKS